ncbi:MAG: ATP-binding cassette domain-containing protein, partial [Treponema sp.]|nr:ATP-binding cassette domain-containing protein [Treponema sp.]
YHFPSAGRVLVDGIPADEDPVEVKKRIGYLPESVPLYGDLSPEEYLSFIAESRLIPRGRRKEALDRSISACGLEAYRNRRIETLSKGYRQRVGLAQAIIHDPPILILDEPTSGLDPNQIIEIRSLIRDLGKRKTVILSTHILKEVEAVADRVLILNEGRIAAQGKAEEIASAIKGGDTWELLLKGAPAGQVQSRLGSLGLEASSVSLEDRGDGTVGLGFFLKDPNQGERIFDWAVSEGLKILSMNRKLLSLEDIFVQLTSDEGGSKPLTSDEGGSKPLTSNEEGGNHEV